MSLRHSARTWGLTLVAAGLVFGSSFYGAVAAQTNTGANATATAGPTTTAGTATTGAPTTTTGFPTTGTAPLPTTTTATATGTTSGPYIATATTTGLPPATTTGTLLPPPQPQTGGLPAQTTATGALPTTGGLVQSSVAPGQVILPTFNNLPIFGYEFFSEARRAVDQRRAGLNPLSPTNPTDPLTQGAGPSQLTTQNVQVSVPERYLLGPGDALQLRVSSPVQAPQTYDVRIDATGQVLIPATNTRVVLRGQTLQQAQNIVLREVRQFVNGAAVDLQLTALRTITVRILGEVYAPGTYELPSVITSFNALYAAGGPSDIGSFRAIELRRTNAPPRRIDLYDLFVRARTGADVSLAPGDILFVPPAVSRVTVRGEVRRPAVYELLTGETLRDAVQFAGGARPTGVTQRVSIDSIRPGIGRRLVDADLTGTGRENDPPLYDGDTVEIFSVRQVITNFVEISGAVDQPRQFAFQRGLRVSGVIALARGTLPDAYLDRADLFRLNPDGSRTLIAIDLRRALDRDPAADVEVEPEDRIVVYRLNEVQFLSPRRVNLQGAVQRPGLYIRATNMTVRDLLIQAGGLLPNANDRVGLLQRTNPNGTPGPLVRVDLTAAIRGDATANVLLQDDDVLIVNTLQEAAFSPNQIVDVQGAVQRPGLYTLAAGLRLSDLVQLAGGALPTASTARVFIQRLNPNGTQGPLLIVNLDQANAGDASQDVVLQPGDRISLFTLQEAQFQAPEVINLNGAFQRPGRFPRSQDMRLRDAIELAGGLLPTSSETLEISSAYQPLGTPVRRIRVMDILAGTPEANVALAPGDVVNLPARSDIAERPRVVVILGGVRFPGPYALTGSNDRLSNLIQRAGGFTERAFPQGAEFARDPRFLATVKQQNLSPRLVDTLRLVSEDEYRRANTLADLDRLRIVFGDRSGSRSNVPLGSGLSFGSGGGGGSTVVNPGASLDQALAKALSSEAASRARPLTPDDILPSGNLNINLLDAVKRPGSSKDVVLLDGDVITIPDRPTSVTISGAVVLPSAVLFEEGRPLQYYLERAGGLTVDAATGSILVIRASGALLKYKRGVRIEVGDTILVPTKVMSVRLRERESDLAQIGGLASSAAITIAIIRSLTR